MRVLYSNATYRVSASDASYECLSNVGWSKDDTYATVDVGDAAVVFYSDGVYRVDKR